MFNIEVQSQEVLSALSRGIAALESPDGLYEAIGGVMENRIRLRFNDKEDPNGVPWKALAESTLKSKKGKGSILERGGYLLDSVTYNVLANGVEVGFGEAYARYHITGSKDGKLPRRDPLFGDWQAGELGAGDQAALIAEVDKFLSQEMM